MSGSRRLVSDHTSQCRLEPKGRQDANGARCLVLLRLLYQPWQRDASEIAVGQEQRIDDDISRQQRPDCLLDRGRALDETEADFRRNAFVGKTPRQPHHPGIVSIRPPLAVSSKQQPERMTARHQWLNPSQRVKALFSTAAAASCRHASPQVPAPANAKLAAA